MCVGVLYQYNFNDIINRNVPRPWYLTHKAAAVPPPSLSRLCARDVSFSQWSCNIPWHNSKIPPKKKLDTWTHLIDPPPFIMLYIQLARKSIFVNIQADHLEICLENE